MSVRLMARNQSVRGREWPTTAQPSLRVLLVGHAVLPYGPDVGGAGLAGYYLALNLAELGHQVHFVTDAGDLSSLPEGVVVHDVSTWYKRAISRTYGSFSMWLVQHLVGNLLAARMARRVLRNENYDFDVVHGHSSLATLLLCFGQRRVPVVYVEHDPGPWEGQYQPAAESLIRKCVFRALDVEVFRRADHTIFVGEAGESEAKTRWAVPQDKVSTIPNGVDTELFTPLGGSDSVDPWPQIAAGYCLYVGTLRQRKGVDLLLRALADVDMPCVVAGDGPSRAELQRTAEELGLSERVLFLGSVPHAELPGLYRKAAMFVFPSSADTTPLALLEAMASGIPPVASSIYGIPKVIQDRHNGLLMPPGDLGALRAAMGRLATDGALREQLGRNARATVLEKFTWRARAREVVRVYESLVQRCPPRLEVEEPATPAQSETDNVQ
jgi:glycosyltransferase involved in cell wall biosynthesis